MVKTVEISVLALDIDGVFTDGRMLYSADGKEQKFISFRDIDAVFNAHRQGLQVVIITGEDTPWVETFRSRLQIKYAILGVKDKLGAIKNFAGQLQVPLTAICFIGDSDRDAPALAAVGLGIAPSNATADAKAAAQIILKSEGGNGAVYEAFGYLHAHLGTPQTTLLSGERRASDEPDHQSSIQHIQDIVKRSIAVQHSLANELAPDIAEAAEEITNTIMNGHKLLVFGNGGSAADAQHFATELVGRFELEREPLAAIALTTDTSLLTALVNDYGPEIIYARQIEAFGDPDDIVMAISTSGSSPNILEGVRAAYRLGIRRIGMTGKGGGELAKLVDLNLCVPSNSTARIQEAHGLIIHLLCSLIETGLVRDQDL